MENGAGQIGVNDLLLARGVGGGYGYGGGFLGAGGYGGVGVTSQVLSADALANGTATKTSIDCNSRQFIAGLARVSDQAEETRRLAAFENINKNITDSEFRSLDRQRDIEKLIVDGQKEAAQCCCDAKLLAAQNACDTQKLISGEATKTRELILEVEARNVSKALDAANARITQLETINALDHRHRNG